MMLTRRTMLAGLAGLSALRLEPGTAQESAVRFGSLRVDVRPLASRGGGAAATLIGNIMPAKLQAVFGDLVVPGSRDGSTLVARIDTISLPGFADSRPGYLYTLQQDTLSGAGVVTTGRQIQSVTPLHVNLPASYSGAYYLPDIDSRRIDSLCYQFAYWLRREMQL